MVYGYINLTSSHGANPYKKMISDQREIISEYCKNNGMHLDKIHLEEPGHHKDRIKKPVLVNLMDSLKKGDVVIFPTVRGIMPWGGVSGMHAIQNWCHAIAGADWVCVEADAKQEAWYKAPGVGDQKFESCLMRYNVL